MAEEKLENQKKRDYVKRERNTRRETRNPRKSNIEGGNTTARTTRPYHKRTNNTNVSTTKEENIETKIVKSTTRKKKKNK